MMQEDILQKAGKNPKKVTWEEVRHLLDYITSHWEPREETPEEIQAILNKRARMLARPAQDTGALADIQHVLVFTLGKERYAVPVAHVQNISPVNRLTPIPCTPRFYVGVVNVRGEVLSVIDLRLLFDIVIEEDSESSQWRNLVVIQAVGLHVCLLADEVSGVTDLSSSTLSAPTEALVGINPDYLIGTTSGGIILLDVVALLSDRNTIIVNEEVI